MHHASGDLLLRGEAFLPCKPVRRIEAGEEASQRSRNALPLSLRSPRCHGADQE